MAVHSHSLHSRLLAHINDGAGAKKTSLSIAAHILLSLPVECSGNILQTMVLAIYLCNRDWVKREDMDPDHVDKAEVHPAT